MTDKMASGFKPISLERYVGLHIESNPGFSRKEIRGLLESALRDHKNGKRCACGNPMWVIGSALVGRACFSCISGEAVPDNDFEIDQALRTMSRPRKT